MLVHCRQIAVVKHNSLLGRFDDEFTLQLAELTAPVWADSKKDGDKEKHIIVMPVREETFVRPKITVYCYNVLISQGLGFISGKKSFKDEERTLTVGTKEIAEKCVNFINQVYEDFRATAALTDT